MDQPELLWSPSESLTSDCNLSKYLQWLSTKRNLEFKDYHSLWEWSVTDTAGFWLSILEYFEILHSGEVEQVISSDPMPQAVWFKGIHLNYAEHIFRQSENDRPAILFASEGQDVSRLSWRELEKQVGALTGHLKSRGVGRGDRVVGWLPNSPEAVVSFLAVNAIGAIWSSTSPDFGTTSVIDRFAQIEPKILIACKGYSYNGKWFDRTREISILQDKMPTLEETILISNEIKKDSENHSTATWDEALATETPLEFDRVPFDHPIWVLYSSGTTGLPKAITHSHGGVLLEHLKYLSFHNDVKPGDRFFWFTTTGWMMWNYLIASMLCGATIVLYDGSPAYPDLNRLWKLSEELEITHFGTSAPFIMASMKENIRPGSFNLSALRSIGSTGAPLPPEGFEWIYREVKEDLWLASISGGTDVCSAFVGGNPLWPVYSGEIQCRALGCELLAFDEDGNSVMDEVGEMVITKPMPSMPIYFWNDKNLDRYSSSYFEMFPNVWRHGDWIRITPRYGIVIYGRSDATLNRGGIRIGTSEIYRVLDTLPEIEDSLIVCVEREHGNFYMPLFVVIASGEFNEELKELIAATLRQQCSPRHVPDEIFEIAEVPYTISGKKTEAPVKKILMGQDISASLSRDALKNPGSLDFFMEFSKRMES